MVKAEYKHPKMKTKKVWAGLYGGHYDIIVFFKRKPKAKKEDGFVWYDCYDNKDLIIGDMVLGQFYKCFPNADLRPYTQKSDNPKILGGRPLDIEIPEVFQMEITTCFDEYGYMEGFSFSNDF